MTLYWFLTLSCQCLVLEFADTFVLNVLEKSLNLTLSLKANFHSGKLTVDWNGQETLSLSCELWVGTNDFNTNKNFLVRSHPRMIFLSVNWPWGSLSQGQFLHGTYSCIFYSCSHPRIIFLGQFLHGTYSCIFYSCSLSGLINVPGGEKKRYDCLNCCKIKTKRAITLKQV